ncbi:MAG: MOSC domain-containing protein [Elusimicrobiota bacterium]
MKSAPQHLSLSELDLGLRALPDAPQNAGRLSLIVRRTGPGLREELATALLTPCEGVPGDAWSRRLPLNFDSQLAVMRRDVAELIAHAQPLTIFGDNLFVDIDISAKNLPVGTRLRVADALVEVTPKPHNGCVKFKERFGQDALVFVQAPATRALNLRGIYWKIVEQGLVATGSAIQVVSRPTLNA